MLLLVRGPRRSFEPVIALLASSSPGATVAPSLTPAPIAPVVAEPAITFGGCDRPPCRRRVLRAGDDTGTASSLALSGTLGSCIIPWPADTPRSKLKSLSWLEAQLKLQPMRSA